MSETHCFKHNAGPHDERWKVVMEELTACEDEREREPFKGEVCPQCYLALKDKLRDAVRNLKVESRQAIHLRADNDRIQKILDAVIHTVRELSGKDPVKLANATYQRFPGVPGLMEDGALENILPNLIVELANQGAKKP